MSKRLIQDLHAGISRRDWHAAEMAANRLRDDIEKTVAILAGTGVSSLPNDYPLSKLAADALTPAPQPNVRSPFELRKRIMFAIFDPGASEGFKGDRDLTTWRTDAVMKVIREDAGLTPEEAWQELCETPDITSPEEYPDHALITIEQLTDYMRRAAPAEGSADV